MATENEDRSALVRFASRVFAKATASEVRDLLADEALTKSVEFDKSVPAISVTDRWDNGAPATTAASKEETTGGSPQSADGSNAEKMNGQFSSNAPQIGSQMAAQNLASNFANMRAVVKSQGEQIVVLKSALTQTLSLVEGLGVRLAKAEEEKKDDDKKDDKPFDKSISDADRVTGSAMLAKAKETIATAVEGITRADGLAKSGKATAAELIRTEALAEVAKGIVFAKGAHEFLGDADSAALVKSAEALIPVVAKAEDEKEEKKDEMDKSVAPVAAAPAVDPALLKSVLDGMAVMNKSVEQVMAMVAGQPSSAPIAPALSMLAKSDPNGFVGVMISKIREAEDGGGLSADDADTARNIVSLQRNAALGHADERLVTDRIAAAPPAVRNFLQAA